MSLEKLFESVDENVLTPELKQSLEESFNAAVEIKSQELADQIVSEKINALNEHCDNYKAQLDEEVKQVKSEVQAEKASLNEEFQQKCDELEQHVSNYMDHVVQELISEHSEKLEECVKDTKCQALDEMFGAMLTAAGLNMHDILAEHANDNSNKMTEMSEKLNDALARVCELEDRLSSANESNASRVYDAIVESFSKDLTIIQASKFATRASTLDIADFADALTKLSELKTRIVEGCSEEECGDDDEDEDNEKSKKDKSLDERLQRFL